MRESGQGWEGGRGALRECRAQPCARRSKAEAVPELSGGPLKNSFNNPAYYVLEGVPHQLLLPGDPGKPPKAKVQLAVPERCPCPPACCGGDSEEEEEDVGTLNLPPPDFPPPPLPRELELPPSAFFGTPKEPPVSAGCEDPKSHPAAYGEAALPKLHPRPPPAARAGFGMEGAGGMPIPGGLLDDRSCSVLQMAKTLSEVDYGGGKGRVVPPPPLLAKGAMPPRCLHPDYGRPLAFPPHSIQESIQEDLAEEVGDPGWVGVLSPSVGAPFGGPRGAEAAGVQALGHGVGAVPGVGEWLRALGLERYEEGLVRNGWDDLEFLR